jgi:hypothetical protein
MVEKYRHELAGGSRLIGLIPEDDLLSLQREIQANFRPASAAELARAVAAIIGSFKIGDVLGDPAAYTKAMTSELAEYPAEVLNEAVRLARRTLSWLPSISEMVAICQALMDELRRQLGIVDRILQQIEAQRARRRRLEDKAARMRAAYGDAVAVSADELELALSLRHPSLGKFETLSEDLERGEDWAATFIRRSALAECARRAEKARRINAGSATAIAKLVMVDEPAARQQLADQIGEDYPFLSLVAIPIGDDGMNCFDTGRQRADFDAAVAQIAAAAWNDGGARSARKIGGDIMMPRQCDGMLSEPTPPTSAHGGVPRAPGCAGALGDALRARSTASRCRGG